MTSPAASPSDHPLVERTGVLADDPATSPDSPAGRLRALESLRGVRSPHVAPLVRVSPLAGGVALTHALPADAVGLDRLRASGPLRAGHVLAVALDVVSALDALSAAGLAHGGVTADRVLVDADGAAVLAGTGLAWTRAPGDAAGPSAADDVAAVGALVRGLLGHVPDGSPLLAVADAATDPDPDLRPTLAELREALTACGRPDRPVPSAADPWARPVPRPPSAHGRGRAPRPAVRRARPGGTRPRRVVVVALALLAVLGTARVAARSSAAPSAAAPTVPAPTVPPSTAGTPTQGTAPTASAVSQPAAPATPPDGLLLDRGAACGDWATVLAAVDAGRREALGAGSVDQLRRWVDPDGSAWAGDAPLAARGAAAGATLEGGDLVTLEVRPDQVARDRAVLLVRDRRAAYRVVDRDGRVTPVPERAAASWRVTLTRGEPGVGADGWRVHDVEPADVPPGRAAGGGAALG